MIIKLYNFTKRINSTLQPNSDGLSVSVNLKNDTSIYTPIFLLSIQDIETYNYLKWNDRYYYIDDIVSIANNLWEISLDCDVLYTYKDKIIENDAFIDRQENLYNDEIIDEIRVYEQGYELGVQDTNVELFNKDTTDEYTSVICCSALTMDLIE